jgi:streptogramin lyase
MAKKTKSLGIAMIVLVAGLVAGCATSGTVKQVTAADASLLTGTWQGNLYPAQGGGQTATVTVAPDGKYTTQAAAFLGSGKLEIKDGYVHFVSTSGTGGLATGERSGSATLMDRGATWGLVGSGYASQSGPFNFDFNKAK